MGGFFFAFFTKRCKINFGNDVSRLAIENRNYKLMTSMTYLVVEISFLISMADWRLYEYISIFVYHLFVRRFSESFFTHFESLRIFFL